MQWWNPSELTIIDVNDNNTRGNKLSVFHDNIFMNSSNTIKKHQLYGIVITRITDIAVISAQSNYFPVSYGNITINTT